MMMMKKKKNKERKIERKKEGRRKKQEGRRRRKEEGGDDEEEEDIVLISRPLLCVQSICLLQCYMNVSLSCSMSVTNCHFSFLLLRGGGACQCPVVIGVTINCQFLYTYGSANCCLYCKPHT
jgi:hypothetical protein